MSGSVVSQEKPLGSAMVAPADIRLPLDQDLARLSEADRTLLRRLVEEPWYYVPHELFKKSNAERPALR